MITWGLVSAATMFAHDVWTFYGLPSCWVSPRRVSFLGSFCTSAIGFRIVNELG